MRKYKLAVLTSHVIQYQGPLFRKVAGHPKIDLTVYFCSKHGVEKRIDKGFGKSFKWDISLLEGYNYKFLPNLSSNISPGGFFSLINPGVFKELKDNKFDAILVYGYACLTNWIAFLSAIVTQTPLILIGESTLLYERSLWLRALKRAVLTPLFRWTKVFLTIGSYNEKFYEHYRVPCEKMFHTPYSVDNDYFSSKFHKYFSEKTSIKRELNLPLSKVLIIFVGKLISRKRPMDLLEAFEKISLENAALIFVGDGKERTKLEDYSCRKGLGDVYFFGFVNQSELPKFYSIGDIFVLPSEKETWGLVINEAMNFALPIITTDLVGASGDIVKHEENGYIYPKGDIEKLSYYLRKLCKDLDLRRKMGIKSEQIIEKWGFNECVEAIYDAIVYISAKHEPSKAQDIAHQRIDNHT